MSKLGVDRYPGGATIEAAASTMKAKRAKTGGRSKGTPNKVTAAAKDAIAQAAADLGGTKRLVAWIKEDTKNETVFWSTIYPKLIPVQLSGEGGGPIEHGVTVRFV